MTERAGTRYAINLLPWREQERTRRNRALLGGLVGALAAGVATVWLSGWLLEERIETQQQRNRLLERGTAVLDSRIREARLLSEQQRELLARMAVIQRLQSDRPAKARIFDELVNTLASGLHYQHVEMRGHGLWVRGVAASNERISALLRNLDGSPWFASADLERIREAPGNPEYGAGASTFELSFVHVHPPAGGLVGKESMR